ncbi:hypothetical protein CHS0354_000656 [Potamilus streckersoni]|uniref:Leucine-binding protein domain-containing protein n=1 Tax=Potamilus streckersoni TaxID=2493646 RepID=A0AAE0T7C7_9BIVA|nr:hypothetical protein CHS0354_000656 [Potamilus streckersoni]
MGISMKNGIALAASEINKAGGILGKQIEIEERDDEAKNERGGQILQELINQKKVVAIFGPVNTGVADASTRYSQEAKIPHIITVSAGAKVNELFADYPDNYVFRIAANDYIQSEMIVNEAINVRGFKRPALLCDETNYGQSGRSKMEAALEKLGIKPVYVGKFKIKDVDMTPQLKEAKNSNADVLFVYGIGPELAATVNSMDRLDWKVDVLGGWTLSMRSFMDNATGKNADDATTPQTFIPTAVTREKEKKFLADYYAMFKVDKISSAVSAAQGYDALYFYKLAVEQAKSTEGNLVKMALEDLQTPYEGVTNFYDKPFSKTNHEAIDIAKVKMARIKDIK